MLKIKLIYFSFLIFSLYSITTARGDFNLAEGKKLTKGIFKEISYLFGDTIEYESTIKAAKTVNELITNANGILSYDQDEDIVDMARDNRKDIQKTLQTFIDNFNGLFEQAKQANTTDEKAEESEESEEEDAPLQYLLDMIKKKED